MFVAIYMHIDDTTTTHSLPLSNTPHPLRKWSTKVY